MKEKIILKSTHPEEYPDLIVECRVIPNEEIGAYLEAIPTEKKFYAYKSSPVSARNGIVGETIKSTLKTIVDGKEYILSEEETKVKNRESGIDIVVTNISSTSNEEYVVKNEKFFTTYEKTEDENWMPVYDSRLLTQVDENIIIMTSWGSKAVCLRGSYIVTYDASTNDYNTLEQGAYLSTYTKDADQIVKTLKNKGN